MKAMLLYKTAPIEQKPLSYEDVEIPKIKGDEVLIKVVACGVCRSNLHMIEGDWLDWGVPSKYPIIPGHEVTGVVEEIGDYVTNIKIGDRVGVQPLLKACGKCEYCMSGRENLCLNPEITGETVDGGYAEYMKAPADYIYKIPSNLDYSEAAPLFCPGVTAYRAVKLSEPAPGKTIAVFGVGGVGHLAIQYARLGGAKVIAVSRTKEHLDLAEEIGANRIIASSEEDPVRTIAKEGFVDASIVFAPSDEAISNALNVTKKGGIIVLGVRGNIKNFAFNKEHIIKGSVIGTRLDMQKVLQIASEGKIKVTIQKHQLKEANEVLLKLKRSQIKGRGVLVTEI